MCGGALEINDNETVATCEYCGTQQTLPKLDDERKANLYDRANHFRRNNEFDKAMGLYEQILNEDNTDAEAYWSIVLCRYGIEYVEDPVSHKRVPTVNRTQFTSIFDDDNYKSALQYADEYQRSIYAEEARVINEIQKGILAISQREKPFDVFICYKETDNAGRRTPDSVLANDLYHQLTQEGFKVFFSRITLEDKLGTAYEPYIFAALNSAKVMVVLGTKAEYFNAVWVKNEWSRFLALIKHGEKKVLIPAYKDMDPYDLPEEFSHLQAQDMSKLGFMQDMIRGIKKIVNFNEPKITVAKEVVDTRNGVDTASLLKRVFLFLEDGDWDSADEYCEKVLDIDPENANAYLGKLLAELKVKEKSDLVNQTVAFYNGKNYQKAIRFGDENLKRELENIVFEIKYREALRWVAHVKTADNYISASNILQQISGYKDSEKLAKEFQNKADDITNSAVLEEAEKLFNIDTIYSCEEAAELYKSISGWKNVDELAEKCYRRLDELKIEQQRKNELYRIEAQKRKKLMIKIAPFIIAVVAVAAIASRYYFSPDTKYDKAMSLVDEGKLDEGYEALVALDGYKDSAEQAIKIYDKDKIEKLKSAEAGDYVSFGEYEQDNNTSNGKENIDWLVLEKDGSKLFVISKYALDFEPYDDIADEADWEDCTLRMWLNDVFLDTAFSDAERLMIPTIPLKSETNEKESTEDRVFLLSQDEVLKYFKTDNDRKCYPTKYAISKNDHIQIDSNGREKKKGTNISCDWMLRTEGRTGWVDGITDKGESLLSIELPSETYVRPAIWIEMYS